MAIGHSPNTAIRGATELENGYIKVQKSGIHGTRPRPASRVCSLLGDVMDHIYCQAITPSTLCAGRADAERYLMGWLNKVNNLLQVSNKRK